MEKYYKVSEEQMDLICSIINNVIEKSDCEDDGCDVESSGMYYTPEKGTWGFICGDDMEDAETNKSDVTDSLKWVLSLCN